MKRRAPSLSTHVRFKGGVRQRRRRAEARDGPGSAQSALVMLLLERFAWGQVSAQFCQAIAAAAFKDACAMRDGVTTLEDLDSLAGIGSAGRYSNKCYADLMDRLPFQVRVPEPTLYRLPFKAPLQDCVQQFLLPHETFATIWEWYPAVWQRVVLPCKDRLAAFWQANRKHPAMQGSPVQHRHDLASHAVPVSFHGDDVPITGVGKSWCSQMTCFSWSSMLAFANTREAQYFIYSSLYIWLRYMYLDLDVCVVVFFRCEAASTEPGKLTPIRRRTRLAASSNCSDGPFIGLRAVSGQTETVMERSALAWTRCTLFEDCL